MPAARRAPPLEADVDTVVPRIAGPPVSALSGGSRPAPPRQGAAPSAAGSLLALPATAYRTPRGHV
ncbi:hypothetical protein [Streptomyces olivaceoviridis]|uniref:hypothetical protein n=1 Tax=Streptomyces olivaceoviridis TaxID=1921 RepID=UPI001673B19D|nr:hypothetical protein [Streptomyces olivaceoviridis]